MFVRLVVVLSSGFLALGCLPLSTQLGEPTHIAAGGPPVFLTPADVNGDGKIDLVVARSNVETTGSGTVSDLSQVRSTHGSVSVMLGRGDGTFAEAFNTMGVAPNFPAVSDLNGDGRPDIAITGLAGGDMLSLLMGRGDGTFSTPVNIEVGWSASGVRAGDFNGDGKTDLAVLDKRPDPAFQGGKLVVLLGHGDGTFDAGRSIPVGRSPEAITVGDWNGDQKLDVAVADSRLIGVIILAGRGDGSFDRVGLLKTNFAPYGLSSPDINHDGKPDLSIGGIDGAMIYLGNGDNTFSYVADYYLDHTRSSWFADFDNDGHLDFVTGRRLFRGDGTGHFTPYALPVSPYNDSWVVAADVNGDGRPDVVAADQAHSRLDVFLNQGTGPAPLRASR